MRAATLLVLAGLLPCVQGAAQTPPSRGGPVPAPVGPVWMDPSPVRGPTGSVALPGSVAPRLVAPRRRDGDREDGRPSVRLFTTIGALVGGGTAYALCASHRPPTLSADGHGVATAGCTLLGAGFGAVIGGLLAIKAEPSPDAPF